MKVHLLTKDMQITALKQVGQVWSGFEFVTKPDQPGLTSLIHLEVMKDKRKILVQFIERIFFLVTLQE